MTKEELNKIIENHKHWLNQDCKGWESMKADLSLADLHNVELYEADLRNANLYGADLHNANLQYANLYGADLRDANLQDADLRGANLCNANLSDAYLYYANLYRADLRGVNLCSAKLCYINLLGVDLRDANLRHTNLYGANLCGANLYGADLRDANLYGADLYRADLCNAKIYNANLYDADLSNVKNMPFIPYACPNTGSFIGYKKARKKIVKLEIPEDAKRTSGMSRMCRCNKAKVLGIYDYENNLLEDKEVASNRDREFIYRVGEIVEVKDFDENRWHECSTGIHFFINFEEAVNY